MNPPALVELSNYPLRNKGNFSAEASFRGNWISMHPSERQEVSEEIFNSVYSETTTPPTVSSTLLDIAQIIDILD